MISYQVFPGRIAEPAITRCPTYPTYPLDTELNLLGEHVNPVTADENYLDRDRQTDRQTEQTD